MLSQDTRIIIICYTGLKKCTMDLNSLKKFKNKQTPKNPKVRTKRQKNPTTQPEQNCSKKTQQGAFTRNTKTQNETVTGVTSNSEVGQQAVGRTWWKITPLILAATWSLMEHVSSQLGVCIF